MKIKQILIHVGLFVLTLLTTTLVGAEYQLTLVEGEEFTFGWAEFSKGFYYSIPFLAILTFHEFGHYFVARYHNLKTTLPYYIPLWFPTVFQIGTMGAVIRIKDRFQSRKQFFDVGVAGPLAGFAIALGVLWYGFTHLPPAEYVLEIHPDYAQYGLNYADHVYQNHELLFKINDNLLFKFFKAYIVTQPERIPNAYEMIHYPWLMAGYLACFFTALNLLPIGQLDGGHILYGLIGAKRFNQLAPVFFVIFIGYGGLGLFSVHDATEDLLTYVPIYLFFLYFICQKLHSSRLTVLLIAGGIFTTQFVLASTFTGLVGYSGWLVFGALLGRVLGVYHPKAYTDLPLSTGRKVIGWLSLAVFIVCASPEPFEFIEKSQEEIESSQMAVHPQDGNEWLKVEW